MADGVVRLQSGVPEVDSLGAVDIRFTLGEFERTVVGVGPMKINVGETEIL